MAAIKYKDANGVWQTIYNMSGIQAHVHGNISNDGKVGTTAGKILRTSTGGVIVSDDLKVGTEADKTLMTGTDGLVVAITMAEAISIWKFTNPNLLHNWDFRNPINQRAVTGSPPVGTYFYDRWISQSGTSAVTINASYLVFAAGSAITQRIEGTLLAGQTVTVSVKVGSTFISGSGTFPTADGTSSVTLTGFGTATLGYNATYMYIILTADAARNLVMCKLEMGTVSTLAYDPPMDKSVETTKCMYFFERSDTNFYTPLVRDTWRLFQIAYEFSTQKRIVPTCIVGHNFTTLLNNNINFYTDTGVPTRTITAVVRARKNFVQVDFGNAVAGETAYFVWQASADL